MKSHPPARRKRLIGMLSAVAVATSLLSVVGGSALSASAMEIDCGYSPGIASWVERQSGLSCSPGTWGNAGSTKGGGGTGGAGAGNQLPAGASNSVVACNFSPPDMPDWLYSNGTVSALNVSPMRWTSSTGDSMVDYRTEYRDYQGKHFADRDYIVNETRALNVPAKMVLTDWAPSHFPALIQQTWSCDKQDWGYSFYSNMSPTTGSLPVTAPGAPDPAEVGTRSGVVQAASSIAAVPLNHTGKYFYRIDVTNPGTDGRPAVVNLDLAGYSISEIIGSPADASCPTASAEEETCFLPAISAGATETITLVVQSRTGAATTAPLSARVETFGHRTAQFTLNSVFTTTSP